MYWPMFSRIFAFRLDSGMTAVAASRATRTTCHPESGVTRRQQEEAWARGVGSCARSVRFRAAHAPSVQSIHQVAQLLSAPECGYQVVTKLRAVVGNYSACSS